MKKLSIYNNSIVYAVSVDKILFRNNCDFFYEDVVSNLNLNCEYNTAITLSPYNDVKSIGIVYIMIEKEAVEKFLIANKFLCETLLEAQVQIECRFGAVPLYLHLHTDYENPESIKLFLVIKNNLSSDDASSMLEDLFKKWFFQKDKKIRKLLTISEE